jgi:hypothetical protein
MPVIRIGGKSNNGTASKKSSSKRSTATKRVSSKASRARKTAPQTAPRSSSRVQKSATAQKRAARKPKVDEKVLNKHVTALKTAGNERKAAEAAHDKAVNNVHKAAVAAIKAGVPMGLVATTVGVSRQWLYKMGDFRDRQNGSSAGKATTATRKKVTTSSPRVRTASKK